jgi:hypothetical protein
VVQWSAIEIPADVHHALTAVPHDAGRFWVIQTDPHGALCHVESYCTRADAEARLTYIADCIRDGRHPFNYLATPPTASHVWISD